MKNCTPLWREAHSEVKTEFCSFQSCELSILEEVSQNCGVSDRKKERKKERKIDR